MNLDLRSVLKQSTDLPQWAETTLDYLTAIGIGTSLAVLLVVELSK